MNARDTGGDANLEQQMKHESAAIAQMFRVA
jgi:hypothetical protein